MHRLARRPRRISQGLRDLDIGNGRKLEGKVVHAGSLITNSPGYHGNIARAHSVLHRTRGSHSNERIGANGD